MQTRNQPIKPITVIKPLRGWPSIAFRELIQYRELLWIFTWRDIKVRYKQTVLGAAWAVIQPFVTMVVFSIFFGRVVEVPSNGYPYPIFSYTALLPWTFFANGVSQASNSVVLNANLISKIYFPRLLLPSSAVLSGLLDFCIAFVVLLGMMLFYAIRPTLAIMLLPVFILQALITALGTGLWLSALNVQYRDVRYAVPFLIQIWLFITPVIYPTSVLPESLQILYSLNPMVGVIEGFRWALLGSNPPEALLGLSFLTSTILLVGGTFYFRRVERDFADVV